MGPPLQIANRWPEFQLKRLERFMPTSGSKSYSPLCVASRLVIVWLELAVQRTEVMAVVASAAA